MTENQALIAEVADRLAHKFIEAWHGDPEERFAAVKTAFAIELTDALEEISADRDRWKRLCAEETIAWVAATARSDELEAATADRAVVGEPWLLSPDAELSAEWSAWVSDHDRLVEAQALEQAAERMRAEHGNIWGVEWIVKTLTAWAVEIREGRQ